MSFECSNAVQYHIVTEGQQKPFRKSPIVASMIHALALNNQQQSMLKAGGKRQQLPGGVFLASETFRQRKLGMLNNF